MGQVDTNGHVHLSEPGPACSCAALPSGADGEELRSAMRAFERRHIIASLQRHGYDKTQTARALGIGVSSLYRKLEELDIPKSPGASAAAGEPGAIGPG
jgi:DNA-binding NtrC family response regulator